MIATVLISGLILSLPPLQPDPTPATRDSLSLSSNPSEGPLAKPAAWSLPSTLPPVEAPDESPMYLTLGAGLTFNEDSPGPASDLDYDEGFALFAAIGRNFGHEDGERLGFDLEFELLYTDTDIDRSGLQSGSDVTMIGGFVNGLFDYRLTDSTSLFVGGGLGVAALDIGDIDDGLNAFDEDDGPFLAWQLKGGARWHISDVVRLELGYRWLNVDDAEIDDDSNNVSFDLETSQHILGIGLQFAL